MKDSYNCDSLSIAGATAAIDDVAWLAENRAKVIATRGRLEEGMRELGFHGRAHAGKLRLVYASLTTGATAL